MCSGQIFFVDNVSSMFLEAMARVGGSATFRWILRRLQDRVRAVIPYHETCPVPVTTKSFFVYMPSLKYLLLLELCSISRLRTFTKSEGSGLCRLSALCLFI